ncbi:MAG TPA: HDIG domain-containing protein [Acidimicrobiia bacterium]|nr:HDIG domain-containing protein [Acidimicrobiia bacterium]
MQRSTMVRGAIFLATVVASWAVLSLGTGSQTPDLVAGRIAEQTYVAERSETVENVADTERARQDARDAVEPPYYIDTNIQEAVYESVGEVFAGIRAIDITDRSNIPEFTAPTFPEAGDADSSSTTADQAPAVLTGLVYLDAGGDGAFDPEPETGRRDLGLSNVMVTVTTPTDSFVVNTDMNGQWTAQYPGGPALIAVDTLDDQVPPGFLVGDVNPDQLIDCPPAETCSAEPVAFRASVRPVDEVSDLIRSTTALPEDVSVYLAGVVSEDLWRSAYGEAQLLPIIEVAAVDKVSDELARQIRTEQLQEAQALVRLNPPQVLINDQIDQQGGAAAAEVAASRLQANYLVNVAEYERLQAEAAEDVAPVMDQWLENQVIVAEGEQLDASHIAAIEATRGPNLDEQSWTGLLAVLAVLVALIGIYLATFRPEFWSRPRMVALLGILIVMVAASVRGAVALEETFSWYVLPAVAFGFITAVLFDQRIAVLMALSVGVLTAVGTLDTGITVYATLAALAPIPFVSAVSSRGAFRNAVALSSLVAAGVAAATSWYFHVGANEAALEVVGVSVAWAFGISVFASLLGLAALQFFESAFDITTTLGLLDLTDRNHEALQMLQEKAFGTFNHSLMVGTLSDAAARSIGANALLARSMAYYHDLGKTENPTFFIENQFGMNNPHDDLDPSNSAAIIRNHVTRGVALAREYKIPTEVTEGIVSHHGDGVMRFFYEKARQVHGDEVDIDDFRHIGHKPRTAESAILMLADSLEAACRAVFQTEEPTPDAIEKVVDRVIDEKLEDGQLSESPLTLADLTNIRQAFLDSLIGHYHQRIAYPNFPGT